MLKICGAAYLFFLAWQAFRPNGVSAFTPDTKLTADEPGRLFAMGFITNLLNPKIAVLYVTLLPQFVDPDRGSVIGQSLILGAVQVTIALTVNALLVVFAGTLAGFLAGRPSWLRAQRYFMGTALAALALQLATDQGRPRPA